MKKGKEMAKRYREREDTQRKGRKDERKGRIWLKEGGRRKYEEKIEYECFKKNLRSMSRVGMEG